MVTRGAWGAVAGAVLLAGPAAAAPSVSALVQIADLTNLSASPDGGHLLFRTERADLARNSYDLEWHSYDIEAGRLTDIGSAGSPIYKDPGLIDDSGPVWLDDKRSFAFRALVDGRIGIWRATVGAAGTSALVVVDADVESLSAGPDGATFSYQLSPSRDAIERAEKAEYDSGIQIDGSVDLAQNLYRGGSLGGRMATQRFIGYWFLRGGLLWQAPRQTYRYLVASGRQEALGSPQSLSGFQPPKPTDAGSARREDGSDAKAAWDGNAGTVTVRIGGGPATTCSDPQCRTRRVAWLAWRPGADALVLAFIDRNRRETLALWDVPRQQLRTIASGDGLLSGSRSSDAPCALTRRSAFCVSASAAGPPRLEQIDLDTGQRKILFDPNASLRGAYHPMVEQLDWTAPGGQAFHGTLLMPPATRTGPLPLFINYYKCDGFLRGGEGDAWPVPSLVDAGFAIACVNAAPFTGAQDAVATYRTGLDGVRSLVQLLGSRGLIDRRKVAMGGFSFGSEVATWVAMKSDILAALSITSAQYEAGAYWTDTLGAPDRAKMMRAAWHLGAPDETPARWKLVSPAANAAAIRAPILMQLPEQEARRIPELAARLASSPTPAELFAFPEEDHLVLQPRHRLAIYERNLDWFRYWLQDYSDPDPAKAAQYQRWGRLRARRSGSGAP